MTKNQRVLGIRSVGSAAALWGTVGPVVQLYPEGTAFQYATMRNIFGVITLWLMVSLLKSRTRYTRQDLGPMLLGGIGTAAFMPFYTLGFQRAGVAVAAIVAIGSAPIFTGIVARVLFKRTPGRPWFIGTGLAVIGVVLLNLPSGDTQVNLAGVLFASVCGFAYALQATGMELLSRRHHPVQSVAPIWTLGTIIQAPIVFGRDFSFLGDPLLLAGTIYGGVFTVAITFSMFTYGLSKIGAPTAVTVGLMEPITAAVLGVTLLDERIAPLGFVGIAIVLAGLVVVSRPEDTSPRSVILEP